MPYGEIGQDAFGNIPVFQDQGIRQRIIIALGKQDILASGLNLSDDLTLLGASSDHLILNSQQNDLKVGTEVYLSLNYGGLLSAMTSPFIKKYYTKNIQNPKKRIFVKTKTFYLFG